MKPHARFSVRVGLGALLASAALPPLLAEAQVEEEGTRRLEAVRVEGQQVDLTASPLAVDFAQFGTQVQLISDEEIETGGFTNFGELAAGLIRGANVGYSPDEGEFTIRIDGGTDRDTLLLVDGVPYFDRSSPSEDLWPATAIDPRMIDTVEVYRGGQSLYFGSNGGLGVVAVKTKEPDGTSKGEFGVYGGSFKTREIYGNTTFPIDDAGKHSILVYGRSYHSDAHELFDPEAYGDNVLALGGYQAYPYDFNSLGIKYLWQIDDRQELRLGASYTTVDFHDSFPNSTVFTPNYTEFPIYTASYENEITDRLKFEIEGHFQQPQLRNNELRPQVCTIPRITDLPATIEAQARARGITSFTTAVQFETFAASIGFPTGCVTNPGTINGAASQARQGWLVNQDPNSPFFGQRYGTAENPFPIGAPIGYVSETVTSFGDGNPVKGFGSTDNRASGYQDWGTNARATYTLNDYVDVVGGVQYSGYKDYSDSAFGVRDTKLTSVGVYGDLRLSLPVLEGMSVSLAGRQDFNDPFDDEAIWKASVRQNFGGGIYARASGGTSYSAPKIDEIGVYGARAQINPGLEAQSVEAINAGVGIDGDILGGTYNLEFGFFQTDILNQFGSRAVGAICTQYAVGGPNAPATGALALDTINANRRSIVPPDAFCATAAAQDLSSGDSVAVNLNAVQAIEGWTIDFAIDLDKWAADFSFTAMDSLEPNPVFGLSQIREGTGQVLTGTVVPGLAGSSALRQSGERPEWSLSGLITYEPTDRWILALNPRLQGPEYAYAGGTAARLVDANGERAVPDMNFGEYFVLNGSIQYFLGKDRQHRILLRGVNLLGEEYFERGAAGAFQSLNRSVVRNETGVNNAENYTTYGWNGKPQSFWVQYEYSF
ncbi:MAG: TonB-dependent receptor [Hyphomonas sp.]|uniref:TonB-dependent receptor plug domain-containing protein n=1 Tax=Hyphomonas sp. TaxID=87 RepID=UPI001854E540|nr:TonB-dependent receptor plug domain-containing protein [Hyphomonas sp.]MBA3067757.1 TonB-dependent receptor [Hyphomonas sp.]MBU4062155.1 TonB-dependent receptor plug domain-containing protein [Alphaproteobacteria bacterium]MBU4165590.1 TonB-dependent receptor plug domain-containing protein [Alphaproteobacteria bacterium]